MEKKKSPFQEALEPSRDNAREFMLNQGLSKCHGDVEARNNLIKAYKSKDDAALEAEVQKLCRAGYDEWLVDIKEQLKS